MFVGSDPGGEYGSWRPHLPQNRAGQFWTSGLVLTWVLRKWLILTGIWWLFGRIMLPVMWETRKVEFCVSRICLPEAINVEIRVIVVKKTNSHVGKRCSEENVCAGKNLRLQMLYTEGWERAYITTPSDINDSIFYDGMHVMASNKEMA